MPIAATPNTLFPHKSGSLLWLNHCGSSPLTSAAYQTTLDFHQLELCQSVLPVPAECLKLVNSAAADLLKTSPSNITPGQNCTLFLNNLALSMPLEAGDEVIVYAYDYPSPVQAWTKRVEQGVTLKKIQGQLWHGLPWKWELAELESLLTARTKVVCVSHVSFTSGFAADLAGISAICKKHKLTFICDAAQSLGCMPIYPAELGIDALVCSGWKWLMGHKGTGLLYSSPELRRTLGVGIVGPDMMQQGDSYLDHRIQPYVDAARFRPSTLCYGALAGLGASIQQVTNVAGIEQIWQETQRLQELFCKRLSSGGKLTRVPLEPHERSGIVSYHYQGDPQALVRELSNHKIIASARGFEGADKYLRVTPFFHHSEEELLRAADSIAACTN